MGRDTTFASHDYARSRTFRRLTDIPGPGIASELVHHIRSHITNASLVFLVQHFDKAASVSKGRSPSRCEGAGNPIVKHIQAVVQIFAQLTLAQRLFEHLFVDATIRTSTAISLFPPSPADERILQHAQQLGLCAHGISAKLVEQKRAVLRQFEASGPALDRASEERPSPMSE